MPHPSTPQSESRNKKIPIALAGDESLGLLLTSLECPAAFPGASAHRFELNSRGDRVAGRLLVPEERSGPCPLILIQEGSSKVTSSTTTGFSSPHASSASDPITAIATIIFDTHMFYFPDT